MFPSLLLHQPLLTSHPSYSLDAEEEIIVTLDPFRSEGGKFLLRLVEAPLPALFMNFKKTLYLSDKQSNIEKSFKKSVFRDSFISTLLD